MTTFDGPHPEPHGETTDDADHEPGPARRWGARRTAIVAAVAVGITGIGGVAAAHAGKLVPTEQSGPGGAGPGGTGRQGGMPGGGMPAGGMPGGTGTPPGGTGTQDGTGTTTTAKSTSLTTGLAGGTVAGGTVAGRAAVSVVAVRARPGTADAVEAVIPTGSRQTRPTPPGVRLTQQPLSTAADVTGTRQEPEQDDDSEV